MWDGGSTTLKVEVDSNEKATVSAHFQTNVEIDDPQYKTLEAWEEISPGHYTYTIQIPNNVQGNLAVFLNDTSVSKAGSKLAISVFVNGQLLGQDSDTLDKPLDEGYGMQVKVASDDFSSLKPAQDE